MKRRLKIMQLESGAKGWAGTERHVLDLSQSLLQLGHDVVIGCRNASETNKRATASGIPTLHLEMDKPHDWRKLSIFLREFRKPYDVVHIHDYRDYIVPAAAARLARVPVVVMTRHLPHPFQNKLSAYACSRLFYDRIIAVSAAIDTTLKESGVSTERIYVVKNAVNVDRFRTANGASLRKEFDLPPGAFLVAAAGRLEQEKGFEFLANAIAVAQKRGLNAFAVIAGVGPYQRQLESTIASLNLIDSVRLLGFRDDIPAIFAAADIVVVPSINSDPFPYVVLEGMASSRPVVASSTGGIPEMIQEGAGLLVKPNDAQGMADAFIRLAQDESLRATISRRALENVLEYSPLAMATKIEAIYMELLSTQ